MTAVVGRRDDGAAPREHAKRGIPHTIPERRDQRERRAKRPGRRPSFDAETYARRNVVERYYRAMVLVARLMVWLTT